MPPPRPFTVFLIVAAIALVGFYLLGLGMGLGPERRPRMEDLRATFEKLGSATRVGCADLSAPGQGSARVPACRCDALGRLAVPTGCGASIPSTLPWRRRTLARPTVEHVRITRRAHRGALDQPRQARPRRHLLGIDVEPAELLPPELLDLIATPREQLRICDDPYRGRLLFAAKEAVYKAVYPLDQMFLDHHDIHVDLADRKAVLRNGRVVELRVCMAAHLVVLALIRASSFTSALG